MKKIKMNGTEYEVIKIQANSVNGNFRDQPYDRDMYEIQVKISNPTITINLAVDYIYNRMAGDTITFNNQEILDLEFVEELIKQLEAQGQCLRPIPKQ